MGYDLIGHGGATYNVDTWPRLLDIARAFGWEPQGTVAPTYEKGECCGTYITNDGQLVTDEDAKALGLALYRALDAVTSGKELIKEQSQAFRELNDSLAVVRDLADYAIMGGFAIS